MGKKVRGFPGFFRVEAACLRGLLTASVSTPTRTHTLDVNAISLLRLILSWQSGLQNNNFIYIELFVMFTYLI